MPENHRGRDRQHTCLRYKPRQAGLGNKLATALPVRPQRVYNANRCGGRHARSGFRTFLWVVDMARLRNYLRRLRRWEYPYDRTVTSRVQLGPEGLEPSPR
jgi:hypothetical protein